MGIARLLHGFTIDSSYSENTVEVAYRNGSFEWNRYGGVFFSRRIYGEGFIRIYSGTDRGEVEKHSKLSYVFPVKERFNIYCKEFYGGGVNVGEPGEPDQYFELVKNLASRLVDSGLKTEVVLVSRTIRVEHNVLEHNVAAFENRFLHELHVYVYNVYMGRLVSSGELVVSNKLRDLLDESDSLADRLLDKLKTMVYARSFNPVHTGRWVVLLKGASACAFYHEVAHLLENDEPVKLPLNYEFNVDLKIVEDPFYAGPLQRLFDDEVYPAWRRTLVDAGVVVDYLRTRIDCNEEFKPGNARGLFVKPKAMYHQLVVKPGDWSVEEVLDEFKRLIIAKDVVKAELYGNYISIYPEASYIYDKGRWMPVRNALIRIPVTQLNRLLIGLTNDVNVRYSFEKSNPIYETTPSTVLEAQVLSY